MSTPLLGGIGRPVLRFGGANLSLRPSTGTGDQLHDMNTPMTPNDPK